jgi:ribosomal protein L2
MKFVRSAGARALLIDNFYKETKSIVMLPSLKVKIICNNSIAFLNFTGNEAKKYQRIKKAGFYVNNGRKPQVRGTVKNSCDHPNGGRTRSLKLSRTP